MLAWLFAPDYRPQSPELVLAEGQRTRPPGEVRDLVAGEAEGFRDRRSDVRPVSGSYSSIVTSCFEFSTIVASASG